MNQSMQPAIQHLFQVPSLDNVPLEQLERMTEEYPCFGFGHYLLSRKLKAGDGDQFLAATRKTSLYFPNPFWLQWMLNHEPGAPRKHVTAGSWPEMRSPDPPAGTDDLAADPEAPLYEVDLPAAELLADSIEKAKELRESLLKINEDFVARTGHPMPTREPELDFSAPPHEPAFEPELAESPADSVPDPEPIAEPKAIADSVAPPAPEPIPDPVTEQPIRDEEPPFVLDEHEQPVVTAAEPAEPVTAPEPAEPNAAESHSPEPVATPEPAEPNAAESHSPEPAPAPTIPPAAESAPLFEPLHTIDYFASQGIRLALDENPTDQLGRQLKSFTEWLRIMRRLPQREREIIPDRVAEEAVLDFAAHSIEGKEPVTETMAEVLLKQGMPGRARLVYEKLSLLNPDKSAYFAAKIEQLNTP